MVRKVLQENAHASPHGWRTHEIYSLALKEKAPDGFQSTVKTHNGQAKPPHLEHPIRSKSFLKEILAHMRGYRDVKIVREVRESSSSSAKHHQHATFVWKLVDKSKLPKPQAPYVRTPSLGVPLGVHEDFSHLNKRRQRARKEKIVREILKLKEKRKLAAAQVSESTTTTEAAPGP
ncbi:hypothetical protein EST38_g5255 [Candolleomyces aberdarensis]|uniref:Uncharacterized protein n=1 Tax=Candolleomyces aberdarensis TaxID=2316362 RepID=A0A4Q2DKV5_9AGAR|nr:hypothetical protein EST38_g5255 [Candolleomyces aberdarensis]